MERKTVVVLDQNDLREALVEHYVSFILNDRNNLVDMLRNGTFRDLPDFSKADEALLVDSFRTLDLGNAVTRKQNVDLVLVKVGSSGFMVMNTPQPENRVVNAMQTQTGYVGRQG